MTNYISLKEFVDFGFLFEANRRFFHPLGLAMTVEVDEDGEYHFVGFQDFRTDPEGCFFSFDEMTSERRVSCRKKANRIAQLWNSKAAVRIEQFGASIEPLEGTDEYV